LQWIDLVFFTGSVYGLAWIITKSKLFKPVRDRLDGVKFLGDLVQCIVCTSVWVLQALLIIPCRMGSSLKPSLGWAGFGDWLMLTGWIVFSSWAIGYLLGDAD